MENRAVTCGERAAELLDELRRRGLTIATAESCTGGNIAHQLTLIPGASAVFIGSVVSYTNELKQSLLNVSKEDLAGFGAVSEPVARQMADGVCRALGADCSVATSGIAGPGGGSKEKPVGTVWIAARTPSTLVVDCFLFDGNRAEVIAQATSAAIEMLLALLRQ